MKRGFNLVLGLVLTIILLSFVNSAVSSVTYTTTACSSSTKTIMKMSSNTNAHGAIFSEGDYTSFLCANSADNDRACSTTEGTCKGIEGCNDATNKGDCDIYLGEVCSWIPANKIIGLSSSTNAHAEGPSQYNYNVDVCYGNLRCVYVNLDEDNTCSQHTSGAYPIDVLSLSTFTNAHIGAFADYPIKVCCKEGGIIEPFCGDLICNGDDTYTNCPGDCAEPRAYWGQYDFSTTPLTSTSARIGSTMVYLIYENEALDDGTTISFEILENDPVTDDAIKTVEGIINSDGKAIISWVISQEDLEKCFGLLDQEGSANNEFQFYFKANNERSGDLITTFVWDIGSCVEIDRCANYENQQECVSDLCGVSDVSVEENLNENCDGIESFCYCEWNETQNECGPYVGYKDGDTWIGSCHYDEDSSDDCDDGLLSYNWKGVWAWAVDNIGKTEEPNEIGNYVEYPTESGIWYYDPDEKYLTCLDGSNTVVCPAQIQLPFFTTYSLVIAIVLIVLIYFLILKNSKKKGKVIKRGKKVKGKVKKKK